MTTTNTTTLAAALREACEIASEHIRDRNGGADATRITQLLEMADDLLAADLPGGPLVEPGPPDAERIAEWLDGIAESTPGQKWSGEMRWHAQGYRSIAASVRAGEWRRGAKPGPLTVAAALMLPGVRDGRRRITLAEHRHQYRVDGSHLWERGGMDGRWGRWTEATLSIPDLDEPCRLIPAEATP